MPRSRQVGAYVCGKGDGDGTTVRWSKLADCQADFFHSFDDATRPMSPRHSSQVESKFLERSKIVDLLPRSLEL